MILITDRGIDLTYYFFNVQCPAINEADNQTNLAFPEPVNSVGSTEADQGNTYFSDSPDETLAPVIVLASQTVVPLLTPSHPHSLEKLL